MVREQWCHGLHRAVSSGCVTPSPGGLCSLCCSSMALQVAAASWHLPACLGVMVGMEPVPRAVLRAAGEQRGDRDIQDIPRPAGVWAQKHRTRCS